MKKQFLFLLFFTALFLFSADVVAQCAMCTKTASQLGEKPALGMNQGILYLMMAPFVIIGYIGYRWWKNNKEMERDGNV